MRNQRGMMLFTSTMQPIDWRVAKGGCSQPADRRGTPPGLAALALALAQPTRFLIGLEMGCDWIVICKTCPVDAISAVGVSPLKIVNEYGSI